MKKIIDSIVNYLIEIIFQDINTDFRHLQSDGNYYETQKKNNQLKRHENQRRNK